MRSATTGQFLSGIGIGDVTIDYLRWGAAAKASVTPQAMTQGTWVSGGWVETDRAGIYQFGVPDAAIVAGARGVDFMFSSGGAIDFEYNSVIVGWDATNGDWETEADAGTRATADQNEHDATQAAIAALNDPTAAEVADAVWDEPLTDHLAAGSTGEALDGASAGGGGGGPSAADIADAVWDEAVAGHVAAGSFGEEVQAHATPAEVKTQADQALVDYDPPTRAEATADKGEIITEIDALETKAQADTRQTALVAEHDATQALLAALDNPDNATITAIKTVVDLLEDLLANRLKFDTAAKQWVLYADNGVTELRRWNAKDIDGVATASPALATERDPV